MSILFFIAAIIVERDSILVKDNFVQKATSYEPSAKFSSPLGSSRKNSGSLPSFHSGAFAGRITEANDGTSPKASSPLEKVEVFAEKVLSAWEGGRVIIFAKQLGKMNLSVWKIREDLQQIVFYKEVMEIIKNQVFRQLEWPKFGLREKYVPVDEAHRICIVIDSDVRSHVEAFQMYRLCAGGIYIPSMILGFPAEEEIILKIENGDELFLTSDDNIGLVIIKARIDEQRPTPKQLESFIKDVTRKGYGIKTTGSGNSDCGLFRGKVVLLDENVLEGGPSRKFLRKASEVVLLAQTQEARASQLEYLKDLFIAASSPLDGVAGREAADGLRAANAEPASPATPGVAIGAGKLSYMAWPILVVGLLGVLFACSGFLQEALAWLTQLVNFSPQGVPFLTPGIENEFLPYVADIFAGTSLRPPVETQLCIGMFLGGFGSNISARNLADSIHYRKKRDIVKKFRELIKTLPDDFVENLAKELRIIKFSSKYLIPARRKIIPFLAERVLFALVMERMGGYLDYSIKDEPLRKQLNDIHSIVLKWARHEEMYCLLDGVDPAATDKKADYVLNMIAKVREMLFSSKADVLLESELKKHERRLREYQRVYCSRRDWGPDMKRYSRVKIVTSVKYNNNVIFTTLYILDKLYLVLLFKDVSYDILKDAAHLPASYEQGLGDLGVIEIDDKDSNDAAPYIQKLAEALKERAALYGEKDTETETIEKSIRDFEKLLTREKEPKEQSKHWDELFGKQVHPDLLGFAHERLIGGGKTIQYLMPAVQRAYLPEPKQQVQNSLAQEFEENLLIPALDELFIRGDDGNFRLLSNEEQATFFHRWVKQLFIDESLRSRIRMSPEIRAIGDALLYGNKDFDYIQEDRQGFKHTVCSFPDLRKDARQMILRAATIPHDEKTWVFFSDDVELFMAARVLIMLSGKHQKMILIHRDDCILRQAHTRYVLDSVREVYSTIQPFKGDITPEERRLVFHNEFLARLHLSMIDERFKEGVGFTREALLSQISPQDKESFRIISQFEPVALFAEFCLRGFDLTEKSYAADPFIMNVDPQGGRASLDQPHYFMRNAQIFKTYAGNFSRFAPSVLYLERGIDNTHVRLSSSSRLQFILYSLLIYEEAIKFYFHEEGRLLANPAIHNYSTIQFSMPGGDFKRPSVEKSFKDMPASQFFSMVEGFTMKEWEAHAEKTFQRYHALAQGQDVGISRFILHFQKLLSRQYWNMKYDEIKKEFLKEDSQRLKFACDALNIFVRSSGPGYFSDESLFKHYSDDSQILKNGNIVFYDPKENKRLSVDRAFGILCDEEKGRLNFEAAYALHVLINDVPQAFGFQMMQLFIAMAEAAQHDYGGYTGAIDWERERFYNNTPIYNLTWTWGRMGCHPEHFAEFILRSTMSPSILEFLLNPDLYAWESYETRGLQEKRGSYIPGEVVSELVRQNNLHKHPMTLLKVILKNAPQVASNAVLKNWRKFTFEELQKLLGVSQLTDEKYFVEMEALVKAKGIKNQAVALYMALNPKFDRKTALSIDRFFKEESFQLMAGILKAVELGKWSYEEIERLYNLPLWVYASAQTRHCHYQEILKLSGSQREAFLELFSGTFLKPCLLNDIYPLNLLKTHPLYGKYKYELSRRTLEYSSFVEVDESDRGVKQSEREMENSARFIISLRASALFRELNVILKRSDKDEISRRVGLIKDFEKQNAVIDTMAYRLLMVVVKEDFEELYKALVENFLSLKRDVKTRKTLDAVFRLLMSANPMMEGWYEESAVAWCARLLGITSQRRLIGKDAVRNIAEAFKKKISEGALGIKVSRGLASEEEAARCITLGLSKKLLTVIAENPAYHEKFVMIFKAETDPQRTLPAHMFKFDKEDRQEGNRGDSPRPGTAPSDKTETGTSNKLPGALGLIAFFLLVPALASAQGNILGVQETYHSPWILALVIIQSVVLFALLARGVYFLYKNMRALSRKDPGTSLESSSSAAGTPEDPISNSLGAKTRKKIPVEKDDAQADEPASSSSPVGKIFSSSRSSSSSGIAPIVIQDVLSTHGDMYMLAKGRFKETGNPLFIFNADAHSDDKNNEFLDASWAFRLASEGIAKIQHMPSYYDQKGNRVTENWNTDVRKPIVYNGFPVGEIPCRVSILEEWFAVKNLFAETWLTIDYDFFSLCTESRFDSQLRKHIPRRPVYNLSRKEINQELYALVTFFDENDIFIHRVVPSIPSATKRYFNLFTENPIFPKEGNPRSADEIFVNHVTSRIRYYFGNLSIRQIAKAGLCLGQRGTFSPVVSSPLGDAAQADEPASTSSPVANDQAMEAAVPPNTLEGYNKDIESAKVRKEITVAFSKWSIIDRLEILESPFEVSTGLSYSNTRGLGNDSRFLYEYVLKNSDEQEVKAIDLGAGAGKTVSDMSRIAEKSGKEIQIDTVGLEPIAPSFRLHEKIDRKSLKGVFDCSIYEVLSKPFIHHQYITNFAKNRLKFPDKYDFIHDTQGAFMYTFSYGNKQKMFNKLFSLLSDEGMCCCAGNYREVCELDIPQDAIAIVIIDIGSEFRTGLVLLKKGSKLTNKLAPMLANAGVAKNGAYLIENFSGIRTQLEQTTESGSIGSPQVSTEQSQIFSSPLDEEAGRESADGEFTANPDEILVKNFLKSLPEEILYGTKRGGYQTDIYFHKEWNCVIKVRISVFRTILRLFQNCLRHFSHNKETMYPVLPIQKPSINSLFFKIKEFILTIAVVIVNIGTSTEHSPDIVKRSLGGLVAPFIRDDGRLWQIMVNDYACLIRELVCEGRVSEAKILVKKLVILNCEIWKRGVFVKDLLYKNVGVNDQGEVVLVDVGRVQQNKPAVSLAKIYLYFMKTKETIFLNKISRELANYYCQIVSQLWTIENIENLWRTESPKRVIFVVSERLKKELLAKSSEIKSKSRRERKLSLWRKFEKWFFSDVEKAYKAQEISIYEYEELVALRDSYAMTVYAKVYLTQAAPKIIIWFLRLASIAFFQLTGTLTWLSAYISLWFPSMILRVIPIIYFWIKNPKVNFTLALILSVLFPAGAGFSVIPIQVMFSFRKVLYFKINRVIKKIKARINLGKK